MSADEPRYNVLLVSVDRVPGGRDAAIEQLSERFSLPTKIATRLVDAVPTPVKKGVERTVAERYVNALTRLGASAQLVAADAAESGVIRRAGSPRLSSGASPAVSGSSMPQTSGSYMAIRRDPEASPGSADDPSTEELLAVSSSPIVAELSDPAIDVPEETHVLDPERLRSAGVRDDAAQTGDRKAAQLIDAGAELAELRGRSREVAIQQDPPEGRSDLGFSSDLAAFVDASEEESTFAVPTQVRSTGDQPAVGAAADSGPFSLPPQVTGQHAVVPAADAPDASPTGDSSDDDELGGFLGDFAGSLAEDGDALPGADGGGLGLDSVDALGADLGIGGGQRPSLFDELQSLSDDDDDAPGLGADISSEPPQALRGHEVPLDDPLADREAELDRRPRLDGDGADAMIGLSTRETLEDDIMSLTNSYRAIEKADDDGEFSDPELDDPSFDGSMSRAQPGAVGQRPRSASSAPVAAATGQQRATTPSGTYIASTGSFTPAPRRPAWITGLLVVLVLGALGAGGYFGYQAWRMAQPDMVFATATSFYEFRETIGDEDVNYACAQTGQREFLCRYDRGFYRAQFPHAGGAALDAAVNGCYAAVRTGGLGLTEDLTCTFRVDRGGESQKHEMSYHRAFDCAENLLALDEGGSTNCTTRIDMAHVVDGAIQKDAELRGEELYQLRRAIPLDTPVGFLDAREFVVTRESNETQRAFLYEPLAMFVRRRGFAGEAVLDITYMQDAARMGGTRSSLSQVSVDD